MARRFTTHIAVAYENGVIFQRFGHTQAFRIHDVEDGGVKSRVSFSMGSSHGAPADFPKFRPALGER